METVDMVISLLIPKLCSVISDISRTDSDVNWLRDELRSMRSFLEDVEESADHGDDKANSLTWIDQIREAVYDSEDIIESFKLCDRLNSVYSFPCILNSRYDLTSRIQDLRSRLADISRRRQDYISPGSFTHSNASKSKEAWLQGLLASSPFSNQGGGEVVRLWLAEGFVDEEGVAEKYLMELISRSMVQVSMMGVGGRVKACQVHDLLHHLAVTIAGKQSFSAFCEQGRGLVTTIPNKTRRISFLTHQTYATLKFNKGNQPLRSLFLFGISERFSFQKQSRSFRFLRVIDLEESAVTKLSSEIGNLGHLRYLGLKGTEISNLPRSLKNLHNLLTLDVRRTQLRKLQFDVKNLMNLRHLEMRQAAQSIKVKSGIQNLSMLQVATGLQADRATAHRIGGLLQLRKLGVEKLKSEDANLLCCSINNMSSLVSLSISTQCESEALELGNLKPSPCLQKLHLVGNLTRLPDWLEGLQNLAKLRLGLSRLQEDPMPILGKLRGLGFLQLYDYAYEGKVMRSCRGGFERLRILLVTGLEGLEEWEVEEGSMFCIQELWIVSCTRLKAVPSGFQFLATLQKLRLVGMPESFLSRVSMSGSGGEDLSNIRHIASILSQ